MKTLLATRDPIPSASLLFAAYGVNWLPLPPDECAAAPEQERQPREKQKPPNMSKAKLFSSQTLLCKYYSTEKLLMHTLQFCPFLAPVSDAKE